MIRKMGMLQFQGVLSPWAAIVCDLVGKSFVMTAVLKPSATKPKAARKPAPPKT